MKIAKNKNIPKGIKLLDVKWVFTIKGSILYKVRLVIRGFRQINVEYTCTYSLTIKINSFWLTIAILLIYKCDLR